MISIDFIIKLSISRKLGSNDENDSIFVIIDRLTKRIYFVAYREDINIKEFVFLFLDKILKYYKIPAEIISNRDKLFKSKF